MVEGLADFCVADFLDDEGDYDHYLGLVHLVGLLLNKGDQLLVH